MGRVFLQNGLHNISAMGYKVRSSVVRDYHRAFYESLLFDCHDFHEAASIGRAELRKEENRSKTPDGRTRDDSTVPRNARGPKPMANRMRDHLAKRSITSTKPGRPTIKDLGVPFMFCLLLAPTIWRNEQSNLLAIIKVASLCFALLVVQFITIDAITGKASKAFLSHIRARVVMLHFEGSPLENHHGSLMLDIRCMALEDALIRNRHIFLHGLPHVDNSELIHRVGDLWLFTNFIDRLYSIPATYFLLSPHERRFREALGSLWEDSELPRCIQPQVPHCGRRSRGRKSVVLIRDFHKLYDEDVDAASRTAAFEMLTTFLNDYSLDQNYIIITSRETDITLPDGSVVGSGKWWEQQVDEFGEGTKTWGRATPHRHVQQLPDFAKFNI
jgi:hypothetical protein